MVADGDVDWTSGVVTQYAASKSPLMGQQPSFHTDETEKAKAPAITVTVESRA